MSGGIEGHRKSGGRACICCTHPGAKEIDALLLNGAPYHDIIRRMRAAHPGAPALHKYNLTKHKNNHLLNKPITTEIKDPDTGELVKAYVVGHLARAIEAPKDIVPAESIPVPDALKVIINAGLRNIASNPELVTPVVLMTALEMARKMGIGSGEEADFKDAWAQLGKEKAKMKRKATKKTVTVEETETVVEHEGEPEPEIITIEGEARTVVPDAWDPNELDGGAEDVSDA